MKRIKFTQLPVTLIVMLMISLWGCANQGDDLQLNEFFDETGPTSTAHLEDAIYHEGADAWMVPQADPIHP